MNDQWDDLLNEVTAHDTLLRLSECLPNMIVQHIEGQKVWRVLECLHPDGFPGMIIVRMVAQNGYDDTFLCAIHGTLDGYSWKLLGLHQPGDA